MTTLRIVNGKSDALENYRNCLVETFVNHEFSIEIADEWLIESNFRVFYEVDNVMQLKTGEILDPLKLPAGYDLLFAVKIGDDTHMIKFRKD